MAVGVMFSTFFAWLRGLFVGRERLPELPPLVLENVVPTLADSRARMWLAEDYGRLGYDRVSLRRELEALWNIYPGEPVHWPLHRPVCGIEPCEYWPTQLAHLKQRPFKVAWRRARQMATPIDEATLIAARFECG